MFVISKSRRLACVLCVVLLGANLCKVVASDRMWINKDFEFVLEHMFNVVGLFFFALGMFVRKWISVVPGGLRTGVCFIVLGVACRYVFIGRPMAAVLSSLCMIYGFFILVPGDAWPKQLVRNSFALYLLHGLLLFAYRVATPSVRPAGACAWFFVAISTIILGLFIIEALRKLMPRMIEIAFGGR